MLFTWHYLLLVLVTALVYYGCLKKHPFITLSTFSLAIITFWSIPSAIIVVVLTTITYLSKEKGKIICYTTIGLHLLALYFIKTDLLWTSELHDSKSWTLLGLSYFSLQNVSFLLDNKNTVKFHELLLGNIFFSKFIAGPILLNKDLPHLFNTKNDTKELIAIGTQRILYGLGKKFILADRLGIITNNLFSAEDSLQNLFSMSVASALFTLQMYLDFSAYSDIAIGTAKIFGINLKENFNLPLRSKSTTDYWRKTHISLIDFLSIHVYYPIVYQLRKHPLLSITSALFITFTLSGWWHGNHMGYLLWGGINGSYLLLEYLWKKQGFPKSNRIIGITLTFILISASNFFFKAKNWENITEIGRAIKSNPIFPQNWMVDFVAIIGNGGHFIQQYNLLETLGLLILFLSLEKRLEQKAKNKQFSYTYLVISILSILFFGNFNAGDEFIYVQF